MFCTKCGTENKDYMKFCSKCGTDLTKQAGYKKKSSTSSVNESLIKDTSTKVPEKIVDKSDLIKAKEKSIKDAIRTSTKAEPKDTPKREIPKEQPKEKFEEKILEKPKPDKKPEEEKKIQKPRKEPKPVKERVKTEKDSKQRVPKEDIKKPTKEQDDKQKAKSKKLIIILSIVIIATVTVCSIGGALISRFGNSETTGQISSDKSNQWMDFSISINDQKILLPCDYNALEELGATFSKEDLKTQIGAGETFLSSFKLKDETIRVFFYNTDKKTLPASNCKIVGISHTYVGDSSLNLIKFASNLMVGQVMTESTLNELYGTPEILNENKETGEKTCAYYFNKEEPNNYIKITLLDNKIMKMDICCSPTVNKEIVDKQMSQSLTSETTEAKTNPPSTVEASTDKTIN